VRHARRVEFGFTHMDGCSSEARPEDLIPAHTASATARETLVAASIARRQAGGGCWVTGQAADERAICSTFSRSGPRTRVWVRGRLVSGSTGSKTTSSFFRFSSTIYVCRNQYSTRV
jgi:hypothetical protein